MVWREISPEDLYGLRNPLIVDVRSPGEFSDESIPSAVNVPLFSDEERAEIGIVYKELGEFEARIRALRLISPRVPGIIDEVLALKEHNRSIVIHCWRGGLRSEAVASVLSLAGISCFRLSGGMKAWRALVLRDLREDNLPFDPVVLYGLTGAGKTEILLELERGGCQVLDLEALANHRGSVFGGLGLGKQPGQKNFEAAIWSRLREFAREAPVFLEAESRKIGKLSLPDSILEKIRRGSSVLVECSLESRSKRISKDYLGCFPEKQSGVCESMPLLELITSRLGKVRTAEIAALAERGDINAAVKILLLEYYDPLYRKSLENRDFVFKLSGDEPAIAAAELKQWALHKRTSPLLGIGGKNSCGGLGKEEQGTGPQETPHR